MSSVKMQGNAGGTGSIILASPNTNNNQTLTLPDATGQVIATDGTGAAVLPRVDSASEGGQINFNRAVDNVANWSIDSYGSTTTPHLRFIDGANVRMALDGSGNLLVGTNSNAYGSLVGKITSASASGGAGLFYTTFAGDVSTAPLNVGKYDNNSTTSQIFVKFGINNGGLGSGQINANGASAAAFGSFSDARIKENIVDLPSQLANIMALRPVEFDYIEAYGGGHQIGFIAQEMQQVFSDAVSEDDSEEKILSVTGWSKTEARLVKAIQELNAKVEAQAAEIAALKGAA